MAEEVLECGLKVILDVILLIAAFIPILVLYAAVDPFHRGFYCSDQSIAHPYHDDTIPIYENFIMAAVLLVVVVPLIELLRYMSSRKRYSINHDQAMRNKASQPHYQVFGHRVHIYVANLYKIVGVATFGYLICQLTTDIIKFSIGRLRPHFLAVCKPDWSRVNCTDTNGLALYVTEDVCTTTDLKQLRQARLSFPSGHASFITYTMLFIILYFQSSLHWRKAPILMRPLIQTLCLFTMVYVCATRISDYKHHWSDVIGGAVVGAVISVCAFTYISDVFKIRNNDDSTEYKMKELRPTSAQTPHGCL